MYPPPSLLPSSHPGKKYPVYGVQWHPEKNGFEWTTKEGINHSEHAVAIMQYAANFLVQEGVWCVCVCMHACMYVHVGGLGVSGCGILDVYTASLTTHVRMHR